MRSIFLASLFLIFSITVKCQVQVDKRVILSGSAAEKRVSQLADPTATTPADDAVNLGTVQKGSLVYNDVVVTSSGGNYVVNLTPAPTAYTAGMIVNFKANHSPTSGATLQVNTLTPAKTIFKQVNQPLTSGDIVNGQMVSVIYDGTNFQLLSGAAAVPPTRTISTTAPLTGGGDLSANRTLAITQSSTSSNGYLSSADWNTFNSKEAALTFSNGLTRTSNNVALGGSLTANTTITQAANTLAFTSTGTNGFSVDGTTFSVDAANDRIGIGTAAPAAKLEVEGGHALIDGSYLRINDGIGGNGQMFSVFGNSRAYISGIGGTEASTEYLLFGTSGDNDRNTGFSYTPGTTGAAGGQMVIGQQIKNNANYTHGFTTFYTNGTEKVRLTSAGDVGIGTTSPSGKLSIVHSSLTGGTISMTTVESDAATKYGTMVVRHYTNAQLPMMLIGGEASSTDNIVYIGGGFSTTNAATSIRFTTGVNNTTPTGTATRMTIASNGKVTVSDLGGSGVQPVYVDNNGILQKGPAGIASGCPTGFTSVNASYCIQTTRQASGNSATFQQALNGCGSMGPGYSLCSSSQFYYACNNAAALGLNTPAGNMPPSSSPQNWEYVDEMHDINNVFVYGNGSCSSSFVVPTTARAYRCCYRKN